MTKAKQFCVAAALLLASGVGHASDCSPGSPMYEDAFFAICDAAREGNVRVAVTGEAQDIRSDPKQLGAERNRSSDRSQPRGPLALDSEDRARR